MTDPVFTFRPLVIGDLPIIRRWLAEPHVHRWWGDDWEGSRFAMIERGEAPDDADTYIVEMDGRNIGYIQAYWALQDPTGFWNGVEGVTDGTRGIDFLIGEPDLVNRKFGRAMIRAFCAKLFADPAVDRIIADPHRDNWPANIALKRVGFRDRGRLAKPGVNCMLLSLARGVFKG